VSEDALVRDRTATALAALTDVGAVSDGETATGLTQLEGGWSRQAYVLATATAAGATREFVVRVKPEGALLDTDLRQEFEVYRLLGARGIAVPAVYAYEAGDNAFGGPFFVMDRAPGSSPNVWRRRDRAELEANWEAGGSLAEDLLDSLVRLHAIPAADAPPVLPRRDFEAAVAHWEEVQGQMALVRDPIVEDAYAWLRDREPDPAEPAIVHGDYRIGNCLVDGGRLTGVLDWELATIGDPRFDLGYMALPYSGGRFVTAGSALTGAVAERGWLERRYEAATGEPVDRTVVDLYAAMGALMLFAIMGTGLALYAEGKSTDIRAAWSRFVFPGLRADLAGLMGW
jgi:aminoglycoside phosphotransferase (APT) family kinase protein